MTRIHPHAAGVRMRFLPSYPTVDVPTVTRLIFRRESVSGRRGALSAFRGPLRYVWSRDIDPDDRDRIFRKKGTSTSSRNGR